MQAEFFDGLNQSEKEINQNYSSIAVIDLSIPALFIYDVPSNYDSELIESFVSGKHKLSECSWGAFEGEIIDKRNQ